MVRSKFFFYFKKKYFKNQDLNFVLIIKLNLILTIRLEFKVPILEKCQNLNFAFMK